MPGVGLRSFGIFHQCWGMPAHTDAECVRQAIDATVRAEELGFDVAWFTEQHARMFEAWWGRVPAPHLMIAHLAGRTSRIRLGTSVKLLALDEPVRVAEEMLLLDVLTEGRALLGVGAGVLPGPDGAPVDREERRKRFRERLLATLAILRGDARGTPYPLPLEPHDLSARMAIAATDPCSVALAAREGLGYLVGMFGGDRHPEMVQRFRDAGGAGPVRATRMVHVGADDGAARDEVCDVAEFFYANFTPPVPSWRRALTAAGPPRDLDELLARVGWIVGGPDRVACEIDAYATAAGLDGIDLAFEAPGLDERVVTRSMERFATEVRPRLALAHAA